MKLRDIFGKKLREARLSRGLTAEELGKRSKHSKFIISKYENGHKFPNLRSFHRLLYALRINADHFFFLDSEVQYLYIGDLTPGQCNKVYEYVRKVKESKEIIH